MQSLTKASQELFGRQPDECFESLTALSEHCRRQKEACVDHWVPPRSIQTNPADAGRLMLAAGDDGAFAINDWSFGLHAPAVLEEEVEVEWFSDIGRIVSAGAGADFDELEGQDVVDHFQFGLLGLSGSTPEPLTRDCEPCHNI